MYSSLLILVLFHIPPVSTLKIVSSEGREEKCDRYGVKAREILSAKYEKDWGNSDITAFDFMEKAGDGQAFYTQYATANMICIDNLGYADDTDASLKHSLPAVATGAALDPCLAPSLNTYGQNMYRFMATDGLQERFLSNKNVLEVGCGRGMGAAYIAQNFGPAKLTGIDLNPDRIQLAQDVWKETANLEFMVGNALDLPQTNNTMDVVFNVESSFHYPNFPKFLSEVHRILRPGGVFVWTAPLLIRGETAAKKKEAFEAAGFHLTKSMDITKNVVRARRQHLEQCDDEELKFMCSTLPNNDIWDWIGLPGGLMFSLMEKGDLPYIRFIARK